MTRWLVLAVLVVGCSSNKEPPPDPLGACAKARGAFDKIEAGFSGVLAHAPNVSTEAYCATLATAVKAGNALSFALFATSVKGDGPAAKAAGAVRDHTKGLLAGMATVSDKCPEQPVPSTQAAVDTQLKKARAGVENACSK